MTYDTNIRHQSIVYTFLFECDAKELRQIIILCRTTITRIHTSLATPAVSHQKPRCEIPSRRQGVDYIERGGGELSENLFFEGNSEGRAKGCFRRRKEGAFEKQNQVQFSTNHSVILASWTLDVAWVIPLLVCRIYTNCDASYVSMQMLVNRTFYLAHWYVKISKLSIGYEVLRWIYQHCNRVQLFWLKMTAPAILWVQVWNGDRLKTSLQSSNFMI